MAAGADRGPTPARCRTTGIQQRDAERVESCITSATAIPALSPFDPPGDNQEENFLHRTRTYFASPSSVPDVRSATKRVSHRSTASPCYARPAAHSCSGPSVQSEVALPLLACPLRCVHRKRKPLVREVYSPRHDRSQREERDS